MKTIISLIALILITSCGTNSFTKRKFTKGVYVAKRGHVKKTKSQKSDLDLNYKVSHSKIENEARVSSTNRKVNDEVLTDLVELDDDYSNVEVENEEVEVDVSVLIPADSAIAIKEVVYPKDGEQEVVDKLRRTSMWLLITIVLLFFAIGVFIDSRIQQNRLDKPEKMRKVKILSEEELKKKANLALYLMLAGYGVLFVFIGLTFVIGFLAYFMLGIALVLAIWAIALSNKIRKNDLTIKKAEVVYMLSIFLITLIAAAGVGMIFIAV